MATPTQINILHLTDLHFGMSRLKAELPNIRQALLDDFKALHEVTAPWDLVAFTGDVVNRGDAGEYTEVSEFLKRLWAEFERLGSTPQLVVVPGNHDLRRPSGSAAAMALQQLWDDEEVHEPFWEQPTSEYRTTIDEAFANYAKWLEDPGVPVLPLESRGILAGDYSTTFEKGDVRLGVLGLNTTFLQLSDRMKEGTLAVDLRQVHAAAPPDLPDWALQHDACVLLTHQPEEWLRPDASEVLVNDVLNGPHRFVVHLCGHLHEPAMSRVAFGGGRPRTTLQGSSLFGLPEWGDKQGARHHGYAVCSLSFGPDTVELAVWPRQAKRPYGAGWTIVPDTDRFQLERAQPRTEPVTCPRGRRQVDLADRLGESADEASGWADAVGDSALWELAGNVDDRLRDAVRQIAATAQSARNAAATTTVADPWQDDDYPLRCVKALETLVSPDSGLRAAEVAILLTAPFLREGVLASGVRLFSQADPLDLTPREDPDDLRVALETAQQLVPRLLERAAHAQPADRDAIAMWTLHRAVLRRVDLWREDVAVSLSTTLARELASSGRTPGTADAIRAIALNVSADPEAFPRADGDKPKLEPELVLTDTVGTEHRIRHEALGWLTAIAGHLAVDARLLAEVVLDHLGSSSLPSPDSGDTTALGAQDVVAFLRNEVTWSVTDDRRLLRLRAACPHPALHRALELQVGVVDELLVAADRRCGTLSQELCRPLRQLPGRTAQDELQPQRGPDGRERYETPLLTFRLAHDEIRDLLMGVRLYGDPALAVRELYQNALDACRYRRARSEYRRQPYEGQIRLRQFTVDGRVCIECEDNGVGMGPYELEHLFSRAGRRFASSPEFLWEQAKWRRRQPPVHLWPNSRFGIGVFSYFMLADEIELWTARVGRDLNTSDVLHVSISSSGSLFRVRKDPASELSGGTRIRLYVRSPTVGEQEADTDAVGRVSCLRTLRRLLRYSDFAVSCDEDGDAETWPAGKLHLPDDPGATVVETGADTWLVDVGGGLLADGIVTEERREGYILNLARDHAPVLSVDRKTIESWDRTWARQALDEAARAFPSPFPLDYEWLWNVALAEPALAHRIWQTLVERRERLQLMRDDDRSAAADAVGCFPLDREVFRRVRDSKDDAPEVDFDDLAAVVPRGDRFVAARRRAVELVESGGYGSRSAKDLPVDVTWQPTLNVVDHLLLGVRVPENRVPSLPGGDVLPIFPDPSGDGRELRADGLRLTARVVLTSGLLGMPLREVGLRLARLSVFGVRSEFRIAEAARSLQADVNDAELVQGFGGAATDRGLRSVRLLARVLTRRGMSVDDAASRMERYRAAGLPLGIYDDPQALQAVRALVAHPVAERALRTIDQAQYWTEGGMKWQTIATLLTALDAGERTTVLRGILPLVDTRPEAMKFAVRASSDRNDCVALSRDRDGAAPWLEDQPIDRHRLEMLSVRLEEPVEAVRARLEPYAAFLGLSFDAGTPPETSARDLGKLPISTRRLLSGDDDPRTPYASGQLTWDRVAWAAGAQRMPYAIAWRQLRAVEAEADIKAPPYHPRTGVSWVPTTDDLEILSRDGDGDPPGVEGEVPVGNVVLVAAQLAVPVKSVIDRLRMIATQVPIGVPPIPHAWLDRIPSMSDIEILTPPTEFGAPSAAETGAPSPARIGELALSLGTTVGTIARRLEDWGEALPVGRSLSEARLALLDDIEPDPLDPALLRRGAEPDGLALEGDVPPGHLLEASLRAGRPLGHVVRRLRKFEPLGIRVARPPHGPWEDHIPSWQDLIVLSTSLNGSADLPPGPVSEAHLEAAALAVDEDVAAVRARLEVYAPLYDLSLPDSNS